MVICWFDHYLKKKPKVLRWVEKQKSTLIRGRFFWLSSTPVLTLPPSVDAGYQSYLQVLPPDIDGRKGQLHLLPAGVFMALIGNFNEDEEDPCCYSSSHQHEYPCEGGTHEQKQSRHRDA